MGKREVQFKIWLTENEYFRLSRLARTAGMTKAAFVRARCFDDKKILIQDGDAIRELYREINAVGKNINQIARVANSEKHIEQEVVQMALQYMREIRDMTNFKLKGIEPK